MQLLHFIEAKNILFRVYRMPSHTDSQPSKKMAPSWMQDWHVKGNNQADVLANEVATFHTIPLDKAQPISDLVNSLTLIQNRIIDAITLFPQRPHNAPAMPKVAITYKQEVFNTCRLSKHKLYVQEQRINCMNCHASVSIHTKHTFEFIASACIPTDRYVSYAIGNWHTHTPFTRYCFVWRCFVLCQMWVYRYEQTYKPQKQM